MFSRAKVKVLPGVASQPSDSVHAE
jgi:hypothetical protein